MLSNMYSYAAAFAKKKYSYAVELMWLPYHFLEDFTDAQLGFFLLF